MMPSTRCAIDDFLSQQRIAVVGVSKRSSDFSRTLYGELRRRGYDVVPVNPAVAEVDGTRCAARVQDITPPVEGALLMTPPSAAENVVDDCLAAGVRRIWFYRATGSGSMSPTALELCRQHGVSTIPGECPFMFLPNGAWFHKAHGFVRKIIGSYPS